MPQRHSVVVGSALTSEQAAELRAVFWSGPGDPAGSEGALTQAEGEIARAIRISDAVWNYLGLRDPADVEMWLGAACVALGLAEASLAPASPGAISAERADELKAFWRSLVAGVASGEERTEFTDGIGGSIDVVFLQSNKRDPMEPTGPRMGSG